jgi:hypothetical protein
MIKIFTITILFIVLTISIFAEVKMQGIKGDVKIRHGVSEEWTTTKIGDTLNLDDAIKVGEKSLAILLVDASKKIIITAKSIIEVSDLRTLSQEDLLLKLAMDKILSVPAQDRNNDLTPARTTIIHGEKKSDTIHPKPTSTEAALMQLSGAKVLYDHNYYGTCILRVKDVFRINPSLDADVEYSLITAKAFEKSNLLSEALNEYNSIPLDKLKPQQKQLVSESIDRLKKKVSE